MVEVLLNLLITVKGESKYVSYRMLDKHKSSTDDKNKNGDSHIGI